MLKKLCLASAVVIAVVTGAASSATAQLVQEYGQGYDCPPPEPTEAPCPYPVDPTADIAPLIELDPFWVGVGQTPGAGIGAFVQVGEENRLGPAVGRVGVELLGDGHLAVLFVEDYTGGNSIANTGETINEFFSCLEGTPFGTCHPGVDDPNDASKLTIG